MIDGNKKIYLCDPSNNIIAELNGLVTDSVSYSKHTKDYQSLSCEVDKYIIIDGEKVVSSGYDNISVFMQLFIDGIGYFQIQQPEEDNDGIREYKSVTAYSCEKEFEDKDILSFQVNTGEDGSLERLDDNNLDELGFAKEYVTFYRSNDSGKTDYSLIHYFLEQMPGWTVRDEDIDRSLWYKKCTFDEENSNLYSLLTSVVAPKFECVITFDILHRRIGAIAKEHLESKTIEITDINGKKETITYNNDFDTSIFIGFRNLANSINVTTDEDSIFTQFTCSGDEDLTFEDVNFGQKTILNLSYFMCEPYMRQTTVDKLIKWQEWCEANRDAYIDLSRQWATLDNKNTELTDRVPSDMDYWKQWSEMDSDLLDKNLKYYQALLESLQQSVDQRDESDQFTGTGDDKKYNPVLKSDGSVDHDYYLDLLKQGVADYGGYYTYQEIITYVIPNIQIAIDNKGKVESDQKEYVKTYETDWSLYGITELQNKKKTYEDVITTLGDYTLPFKDATTDKGEPEYTKKYSEYWEAKNNLETLEPVLEQLLQEQASLKNQIDDVLEMRKTYEQQYLFRKKDSAGNITYNWDLTEAEYALISSLTHNTDYTNSNIFSTSIDDTTTKIDREKELFDDSVDKLSEVCQPQYTFTVNMDNLLRIPEFSCWVGDFDLYRFIRLGIRDDFAVKLRIIGITYNPCEITPDLTLEFSNMITSSNGRSDLTDILSTENNRGSKNSISLGASTNYDVDFATTLLQTMMKTGLFRNSVSNIVGGLNITGEAIIDTAKIKNLFSEYIEAGEIKVGYISGDKAEFNEFFSKYGVINELVSQIINATTIYADQIRSKDGQTFIDLVNSSMNINTVVAKLAKLEQADIGSLFADTAFAKEITSLASTTAKATIDSAYIIEAVAGKMTIGDLKAGDIILSDTLRILSDKGANSGLIINGSTMQFLGSDGTVGIQIGFGKDDKPSIIIKDENGTALFTSTGANVGVQAAAIADGLIVNDMVKDKTLSKDKINFPIIEPNEQGGIDITNIYDGKGNKWGLEYESFKQNVNDSINAVESVVDKENQTIKESVWEKVYLYKPSKDSNGDIIFVNKTDEDGNLVLDSDGNPIKVPKTSSEKDPLNIIERTNETTRNLDELTSVIYYKDGANKVSRITQAQQTAEKFTWMVKSESNQSNLILTDSMLQAITAQFKITGTDGTSTIIEGGKIKAGSIDTDLLNTSAIKSKNYQAGIYKDEAGYSLDGTFLDLSNGLIHMPGYYNDLLGNTYIRGNIQATSGLIGIDDNNAWKIGATTIITSGNTGKQYASLAATGNAIISTGKLQLHDNKLNTYNYGQYIKYNGTYYDYGIQTPELDSSKYNTGSDEKTAGSFIYVRSYTPTGSSSALPQYDTSWKYLLRITKMGEIYFGDTLISGNDGAFLSKNGGTITGDLTVTGTITGNFTGSATSVSNALSINGNSYNGSAAVSIDVRNIIQGGDGTKTASNWTPYGLIYASSSTALSSLSTGTAGQILKSNGSAPPTWVDVAELIKQSGGSTGGDGDSSKYVTLDTAQTISGKKSFTNDMVIYSTTKSTSTTTGALSVKGGICSEDTISGNKVMIGNDCTMEMDSLGCLNFIFV